jgi:hypothetical protein
MNETKVIIIDLTGLKAKFRLWKFRRTYVKH